MDKVIKYLMNSLLAVVIIVLLGYIIMRTLNIIDIFSVKTGSMEDNIHVGDYILIFKKADYDVGDIVTFKSNEYFVTHRIVRKEGDKYITKGDANNIEDEGIEFDNIIGKVVMVGGLLNIIINFKYAIVSGSLALYLLSCYFDNNKKIV